MSFLHSFDFQVMVCHPLEYAEFRLAENLVVIVAKGMFVCLILATDQLVSLFVLLIPVTEDVLDSLQTILDILYYIEIFAVVKMFVLKAIYSVTIFKIAYMTKAGLENSCQVSGINDKKRQAMLKSIYYFSLIPFFLNILFVVHEALSINTNLIQGPGEGVLSDRMRQPDVQLTLTLVVFTIGSFSYYIGYWVLFPKLRNTLLCKSNDNQEIMTWWINELKKTISFYKRTVCKNIQAEIPANKKIREEHAQRQIMAKKIFLPYFGHSWSFSLQNPEKILFNLSDTIM